MDAQGKLNPDWPSVFIEAEPFAWRWFAGIPRYTARLALALAAQNVNVRFLHKGEEFEPLPGLDRSADQDIELWARRVWHGERIPHASPPSGSIGLYCGVRPEGGRLFPFEVSVLHDLCPLIGGFTFPDAARWGFEQFYSSTLLKSDLAIAEEFRGHHTQLRQD